MYAWFLGGKDNYPVDVETAEQLVALEPRVPVMARVNRSFMQRATHWLALQGVRQFLSGRRARGCVRAAGGRRAPGRCA
jgi:predicted DNA-binding helix-hairpin-helix protein